MIPFSEAREDELLIRGSLVALWLLLSISLFSGMLSLSEFLACYYYLNEEFTLLLLLPSP